MDGSLVFFLFIVTTISMLALLPFCMRRLASEQHNEVVQEQGGVYEVVKEEDEPSV